MKVSKGVWALATLTLVLFVLTARGYGYFRDELYYLACGEHLDIGYVDHPPLIGIVAALVRSTLGESLIAIRLLPALAAAATVFLAGAIARELGGGGFAQALASVATVLCPVYLSVFSILSMNAFDVLIWAAAFLVLARLLRTGEERLWLAFGLIAGIGLQNKISVLFLGFGLTVGLVLSRRWEIFRSRYLWIGGGIAALIFLPHILWQMSHDWPTLEFMENARRFKMNALPPAAFVSEQVLYAGPIALPVWLSGLAFLMVSVQRRPYRTLGWAFLAILALMIATHAKPYYLGPAYTILFAAGGAAIERWTSDRARTLRPALVATLAAGGVLVAPLAKPLLPKETFIRYSDWLGIQPAQDERNERGRLPQFYADMIGWPELAETVAKVHGTLPEGERSRACIFGQNYGQAGAIDFFGPALRLPKAVSAHNGYYLWGPRDCTGEVMIVIGDDRETLSKLFGSVELATTYTCSDCMPYENDKPIWIARGLRQPLREIWPSIKKFI
jgi:hypothetical protein